jgi:hypothetical protein
MAHFATYNDVKSYQCHSAHFGVYDPDTGLVVFQQIELQPLDERLGR